MFGFLEEYRNIQRVIRTKYRVIFYAESAYYYQYFHYLAAELKKASIPFLYITSDRNDPLLNCQHAYMEVVYSRSTIAFAFGKLQADVMIMTMPDLEQFIFKRSEGVKKYVYVFHALVSTHQQYRRGAFDHYDAVFCAGPHHEKEIRETEQVYALPPKQLIAYGYPLLGDLAEKTASVPSGRKRILVAPSWYEHGIFQTCILELVKILGTLDHEVVIRPHPEFRKRNRKQFRALERSIRSFPSMKMDLQPDLWDSLLSADHLITDRSGIAFEFAFVKERPVIFIDTPLKIQNRETDRLSSIPVENRFRESIGICISPKQLDLLPARLAEAEARRSTFRDTICQTKKEVLYDPSAARNGIQYIVDQLS